MIARYTVFDHSSLLIYIVFMLQIIVDHGRPAHIMDGLLRFRDMTSSDSS
jgi:hypothetical protein